MNSCIRVEFWLSLNSFSRLRGIKVPELNKPPVLVWILESLYRVLFLSPLHYSTVTLTSKCWWGFAVFGTTSLEPVNLICERQKCDMVLCS